MIPLPLRTLLLGGVWACLGLVMLAPVVTSGATIYPYIVPKTVYARLLIEAAFVLWALLALADPRFRPPRSRVLLLLAAGAGLALLAAFTGVSPDRSLWSTYQRMLGVVDQVHWLALALVLASVVREERHWLLLVHLNLAVVLLTSVLVVLQAFGFTIDVFGKLAVIAVRYAATLGNPLYMGGYAMLGLLLSLGLLARSFERPPEDGPPREPPVPPWAERCFLGTTALFSAWALVLTVARGPMLGLFAAFAFGGLVYISMPGRSRRLRAAVLGTMAAGVVVVGTVFTLATLYGRDVHPMVRESIFRPLFGRGAQLRTINFRLEIWEAGWDAFLERPVLGWGPENFLTAWGQHFEDRGREEFRSNDTAHSKAVEELVAKGAPGLLLFLALWAGVAAALRRCARRMDARGKVMALAVGTALLGYFVQSLTGLDSLPVLLVVTLLLGWVIRLEGEPAAGEEPRAPPRWWARSLLGRALTPGAEPPTRLRWWVRGALASAAAALAAGGVWVNAAMWNAARETNQIVYLLQQEGRTAQENREGLRRAIDAFRPAANTTRPFLFRYAASVWEQLATSYPHEARETYELVRAEERAAVGSEPESWDVHHDLAEMYAELARIDPGFAPAAEYYFRRTLELAPRIGLEKFVPLFGGTLPSPETPPEP